METPKCIRCSEPCSKCGAVRLETEKENGYVCVDCVMEALTNPLENFEDSDLEYELEQRKEMRKWDD